MPELTVSRNNTAPPPLVCMYCGAPATITHEWQEVNRRPEKGGRGGGTNLATVSGDDPVSLVIGVIMLPFALWELLKGLVAAIGAVAGLINRAGSPVAASPPAPPAPPKTTRVVITACARHRRFRARFAWTGVGVLAVLIGLWIWAVLETRKVMGTEDVGLALTLILTAILATVLLPLALSTWYVFCGPVIAERVTEDTVVLDRVRPAYFDATGIKPSDPM